MKGITTEKIKKSLRIFAFSLVATLILSPIILTLLYSFMDKSEAAAFFKLAENTVSGYLPIKLLPEKASVISYYELLVESVKFNAGFWNSVKYALVISVGQLIIGTGAAFVFAKFRFKCRNLLFFIYIAIMMMPFQVTLVPNYIALKTVGMVNTGWAVVLPGIFSAFGVFIIRQFMLNISDSIIEAAQIDGANTYVIFGKIILPLAKTGIIALFVLSFIDTWNMVEQPLIFLRDIKKMPLTILIRSALDGMDPVVFPPSVLYMVPAILAYLLFRERLIEGIEKTWLIAPAPVPVPIPAPEPAPSAAPAPTLAHAHAPAHAPALSSALPLSGTEKKGRLLSGKACIAFTIIYSVIMATAYLAGPSIARSISPVVRTAQITGGYIGGSREYQRYTVPNNAVFQEGDRYYIFVARNKREFWIEGLRSIKIEVEIIDKDDKKTAISSGENIPGADYVIYESNKELKDGGRVFK